MRTIEEMDVIVWRTVAALTAGTLAVCMVRTILGKGDFPWWHLATLAITWRMGECDRALSAISARARILIRKGSRPLARLAIRVKSAVLYSMYSLARKQGRLGGAPALFKSTTEKAA